MLIGDKVMKKILLLLTLAFCAYWGWKYIENNNVKNVSIYEKVVESLNNSSFLHNKSTEEDSVIQINGNVNKEITQSHHILSSDNEDIANNPHLKFKGIPIDGTLDLFVRRMCKVGFNQESSSDGISVLTGDFASFKNCKLYVYTLDNIDVVSKISVQFPSCEIWSDLYGNYKYLKDLLMKKYGKPSFVEEKFQTYSTPNSDSDRFFWVQQGACKYSSKFITEKGDIILSIYNEAYVTLFYKDKINSNSVDVSALNDL